MVEEFKMLSVHGVWFNGYLEDVFAAYAMIVSLLNIDIVYIQVLTLPGLSVYSAVENYGLAMISSIMAVYPSVMLPLYRFPTEALELPQSGACLQLEHEQVATKTNDSAGDNTTTVIVLARQMIKSGLLAAAFGANPISLTKGMERTVKELIKVLKSKAIPVRKSDDIKAGNDDFIGNLIVEAIDKIGHDEILSIESSSSSEISVMAEEGA
ncbi:chaperonin 60 subunit alpha 2, chloroplastic [Artemisia annua]|uniref:Chaperonin 60 subunit alpha 2, chloroplastic n=1 Tax=Artemisia annua TaxID=35608 RepID=A0A2U1KSB0_ARTAN|nr:chaperonin 60 subunit alpha 2, chloroplastic [Artemisia annua]